VGYESLKIVKSVFLNKSFMQTGLWCYHVLRYCVFVSFNKCVEVDYRMIGRCIRTHTSDYPIMILLCGCSFTLPDSLICFSESF
jgi:hypothetical protein